MEDCRGRVHSKPGNEGEIDCSREYIDGVDAKRGQVVVSSVMPL
jgi:hypothetical protein